MRAWIALLLLVPALAGCSADDTAPEPESEFKDYEGEVQATDTTGVILGVVVDETITPIEGATVSVRGEARSATSDAQGRFAFSDLPEGAYFLDIAKPGYGTVQQGVQVQAGEDEPPVVKVILSFDESFVAPYYDQYYLEGFIECGLTVIALCGGPNTVMEAFGQDPVTSDKFHEAYNITPGADWIQSEMIWDGTQPQGGEFNLVFSIPGVPWSDYAGSTGGSPLLVTAGNASIAANDVGGSQDLHLRVFTGGIDDTGLVGATVQQKYEIFTHVFYGYTPGEWRFSDEPTPPSPDA